MYPVLGGTAASAPPRDDNEAVCVGTDSLVTYANLRTLLDNSTANPIVLNDSTATAAENMRSLPSLEDMVAGKKCASCSHEIEREVSFAYFGRCKHVMHLHCVAASIRRIFPSASNNNSADQQPLMRLCAGGEASVCFECSLAKLLAEAKNPSIRTAVDPASMLKYRDRKLLLAEYKSAYNVAASTQYDTYKEQNAPDLVVRTLLYAGKQQQASFLVQWSKKALDTLRAAATTAESGGSSDPAAAAAMSDNGGEPRLPKPHEFINVACGMNRSLDDMFATNCGYLIEIYRAGARTANDLAALRFNFARHMAQLSKTRAPVWQYVDLYNISLSNLLNEGGMTLATIAKEFKFTAREWALLGARASTLLSMLDSSIIAAMHLSLDEWRKFLDLQYSHLHALQITTRAQFEAVGWDANDEWCGGGGGSAMTAAATTSAPAARTPAPAQLDFYAMSKQMLKQKERK